MVALFAQEARVGTADLFPPPGTSAGPESPASIARRRWTSRCRSEPRAAVGRMGGAPGSRCRRAAGNVAPNPVRCRFLQAMG